MDDSGYPWDAVYAVSSSTYFAYLSSFSLFSWFRQYTDLIVESDHGDIKDRNYFMFTLLRHTKNEGYQVIQGIFSKKEGKVYDARYITAASLDSPILKAHEKKELVIWS